VRRVAFLPTKIPFTQKNQNCIFENYDFLVGFLGRTRLFHDKIQAARTQPAQWSIALGGQ